MSGDYRYRAERRLRVALVTARAWVDVDVDLPLLAERLRQDAHVKLVAWDDLAVDWSTFDLALILPPGIAPGGSRAPRSGGLLRSGHPARQPCERHDPAQPDLG